MSIYIAHRRKNNAPNALDVKVDKRNNIWSMSFWPISAFDSNPLFAKKNHAPQTGPVVQLFS